MSSSATWESRRFWQTMEMPSESVSIMSSPVQLSIPNLTFCPEYSNNVWIDHCDVSSDRDHDKDYYDGLIDVRNPTDLFNLSYHYTNASTDECSFF